MMKFLHALVLVSIPMLAWFSDIRPALSQDQTNLPVEAVQFDYSLGEPLIIQATFPLRPRPADIQVFLQAGAFNSTWSAHAVPDDQGKARFEIAMQPRPIRTFSELTFWFEGVLPEGQTAISQTDSFLYLDNRFSWESIQHEPFRVYWYAGETEFAQDALEVAQTGLNHIQTLLSLNSPEEVSIYIYAHGTEMRPALQYAAQNWVGAHADPDLGVMLVSISPGPNQRLEMERQIPHELMHILLYQSVDKAYLNLPTWLLEGLASTAELYPNPEYYVLLNDAVESQELLPVASLCGQFPRAASAAYLAYAESASFIRYLHRQYGREGLDRLVRIYGQGAGCEDGVQLAFDTSLSQLERDWRLDAFGEKPWNSAMKKLAPWLVVMVLLTGLPLLVGWRALHHSSHS